MGSPIVQSIVLLGGFVVQIVTLCYLIKYVRATVGIQKAAVAQTQASQDLARWQPEQWRRDSRGQEWRELIGTLATSVLKIEAGPPPHPFVPGTVAGAGGFDRREPIGDIVVGGMSTREAEALRDERSHWLNEALFAAARVISDRLLITDVLEREHIREEWREIEVMSGDLPLYQQDATSANGEHGAVTGFLEKWKQLRKKLVGLAQQDLGVAALAAGTDIRRG
jgi:hypothetical protein